MTDAAFPRRCVVDTNVATTANGANKDASPGCVAVSARALLEVTRGGHVFLDDADLIVSEYRRNLSASGQPGPGDVFFKWLLTHQYNPKWVTLVPLTPRDEDPEDFEELPPTRDVFYDRSDRKFLAVACAHEERPAILQALDSKWWGWREALAAHRVTLHFLCPAEIAAKHAKKMGS